MKKKKTISIGKVFFNVGGHEMISLSVLKALNVIQMTGTKTSKAIMIKFKHGICIGNVGSTFHYYYVHYCLDVQKNGKGGLTV